MREVESMYIPDETSIESGLLNKLIAEGRINEKVLLHNSIIKHIEHKALNGDFRGVRELENACKKLMEKGIPFEIINEDLNLRKIAFKTGSIIVTADYVSAIIAKALGLTVLYEEIHAKADLTDFFKERDVMSVHLKENLPPRVKRGKPGRWTFETLSNNLLSREEMEDLVNSILDKVKAGKGFIETDKESSTIVQMGPYRIVITRPPFSDGLEITAVRP
ncbi:hypothetical protein H5T51_05860, partial [Candidatus Bathyarchaeota archaeon]|nr:hypothetical protein [Candidatus Bathyarchaeota archaeon]